MGRVGKGGGEFEEKKKKALARRKGSGVLAGRKRSENPVFLFSRGRPRWEKKRKNETRWQ